MAMGYALNQKAFFNPTLIPLMHGSRAGTNAVYVSTFIVLLLGFSLLLGGLYTLLGSVRRSDVMVFAVYLIIAAGMLIVGTHMVVASIANFILWRKRGR